MLWINFLHLYQPANAEAKNILEATEKSYLRIIRAIEEHPKIKFTLNITGCLFLRWDELGYHDLISKIKNLIKNKQLELTGSSAYHHLLPLIPEKEIYKQILENEKILEKYLNLEKPQGFFLPEMAYSEKVGNIIHKAGYEWLILDEITTQNTENQKLHECENTGLKIISRSRQISNTYVPKTILEILKNNKNKDQEEIITATDAELYGLRYIDHTANFEELLKNPNLKTKTISEFLNYQNKNLPKTKLQNSSWESNSDEIKSKNSYPLWQDKKNKIQKKTWQLANLAYNIVENNEDHPNYEWARWHLVRGLASCTFWWASGKDFSKTYGPRAWNPDEIEKRIIEFIKAIRSLESRTSLATKIKAEKLVLNIKKNIWKTHWKKYARN